jgi:release factor glutamine methyltransferase
MRYRELYNYGISFFIDDVITRDIMTEIEWYIEDISGKQKIELITGCFDFSQKHIDMLENFIKKRKQGIPYSYITGKKEFFGLEFNVNQNVLIPRDETEIMVENILDKCSKKTVLDMCTGSGCISVCLARFGNPEFVCGTDISKKAVDVAKENADILLSQSENSRLSFVVCDKLSAINNKFDIIVSNPPYISSEDILTLEEKVKDFEPLIALDGGEDGMYFYRYLAHNIDYCLKKGGSLFLEIGYDQGEKVYTLFKNDFEKVSIIKDYAQNDRFIFGENFLND